jgi:hypothetical protein
MPDELREYAPSPPSPPSPLPHPSHPYPSHTPLSSSSAVRLIATAHNPDLRAQVHGGVLLRRQARRARSRAAQDAGPRGRRVLIHRRRRPQGCALFAAVRTPGHAAQRSVLSLWRACRGVRGHALRLVVTCGTLVVIFVVFCVIYLFIFIIFIIIYFIIFILPVSSLSAAGMALSPWQSTPSLKAFFNTITPCFVASNNHFRHHHPQPPHLQIQQRPLPGAALLHHRRHARRCCVCPRVQRRVRAGHGLR